MQRMEKRRPSKNSDISSSQSYSEAIKSITGCNTNFEDYVLSDNVIEERKQYWDNLIQKYTELPNGIIFNIDALGEEQRDTENCSIMPQLPMSKSPSLIQYWINTGNHPYNIIMSKQEYSDSGSSLSEKELSTVPHSTMIKDLYERCGKSTGDCNSSSTSVDTAAYILSNTNVTKNAKSMAILKGAKYSTPTYVCKNSVPVANLSQSRNKLFVLDNKNLVSDNINCPNYFHTSLSSEIFDSVSEHVIDKVKGNEMTRDKSLNKRSAVSKKTTLDVADGRSDFENEHQRLENDSITEEGSMSQKYAEEQTSIKESFNSTFSHHKKLYSGRDSPVDLVSIKSRHEGKLSQPRRSTHPALDPNEPTKRRVPKKRKTLSMRRKGDGFAKADSTDADQLKNVREESQTESHDACQTSETDTRREREDMEVNAEAKCNNETNSGEDEMSSIYSSYRNEMRAPSNELIDVAIQNSAEKSICVNNRPVSFTILKLRNLNPVVRLTSLSEREIKKYRKLRSPKPSSTGSARAHSTRLAELNAKTYERHKRKVVSLPQTASKEAKTTRARLQSNTASVSTLSSRIQNVDIEDVNSEQTTLLICKCNNYEEVGLHMSASSTCTNNSSQDVRYCYSSQSSDHDSIVGKTKQTSRNAARKSRDDVSFVTLQRTNRNVSENAEPEAQDKNRNKHRTKDTIPDSGKPEILSRIDTRQRGLRCDQTSETSSKISSESSVYDSKFNKNMAEPRRTRSSAKKSHLHTNEPNDIDCKCDNLDSKKFHVSSQRTTRLRTSARSNISDELELIIGRSSTTNTEVYNLRRKKYPLLVLSSDEDEEFVKLIQQSKRKKQLQTRSNSEPVNQNTNNTIDKENTAKLNSVLTSARNRTIFPTPMKSKSRNSVRISDQIRFDTQESWESGRSTNVCNSRNNDWNNTTKGSKRNIDLVSSSEDSLIADNTPSAKRQSFSTSPRGKLFYRLRNTENKIHCADDLVDKSIKCRRKEITRNRLFFQTEMFDSSSESPSLCSDST